MKARKIWSEMSTNTMGIREFMIVVKKRKKNVKSIVMRASLRFAAIITRNEERRKR